MLRGVTICSLCFIFVFASIGVHAEVSVRTDRQGNYLTTQVLSSGPHAQVKKIWSPRGRGLRKTSVLNPAGDANGDLWPAIAEPETMPHHPWVVWSRFNGAEYDLAWSRWSSTGWSSIDWLSPTGAPGDDLDPDVAFDSGGRPYAVWWRDEEGGGRVFVSVFLVRRWTAPYLLSDPAVDSRYPSLQVGEDGMLSVQFETPEGTVNQLIVLRLPDTITDDINPQIYVKSDTLIHANQHKQ